MKGNNGLTLFAFFYLLLILGCTSQPEPIAFAKDVCSFCKMVISDPRFGAELVTDKGRVHKYDAVECMIAHIHEENIGYSSLLAIAYDNPKTLYFVDSPSFIQSPDYRGPMGNTAAFYGEGFARDLQVMSWADLFSRESAKKIK